MVILFYPKNMVLYKLYTHVQSVCHFWCYFTRCEVDYVLDGHRYIHQVNFLVPYRNGLLKQKKINFN